MSRLVMVVTVLFVVAGCGGMLANIMPLERKQIEDANKNGDLATLERACSGQARLRYSGDKRRACQYLKRHKSSKGTCDDVVARYKGTSKDWPLQQSFGREFAKCNKWTEMFEVVVHWGNRAEGAKLLAMLDSEGVKVEEAWVAYLDSHKGAAFFAMGGNTAKFALDNIGKWLLKKGAKGHCRSVVAAATGANEIARAWVLPYLKGAGCAEGAVVANSLLTSDRANHRMWACQTLGIIGGKNAAAKLEVLAASDPYNEVREERRGGRVWGVKVWPVRDACKAAAGKIKLRSM